MANLTANKVWRDYATDGVPPSGIHRPSKAEIRSMMTRIEQQHVNVEMFEGATAQIKVQAFFDYLAANGGIGFVPQIYTGLTARINVTATKPFKLMGITQMSSGFQWNAGATNGGGLQVEPALDVFPIITEDINFETLESTPTGTALKIDYKANINATNIGTRTYNALPANDYRGWINRVRVAGATGVTTDAWKHGIIVNVAKRFMATDILALGKHSGSVPNSAIGNAVSFISRDYISRTITNVAINRTTGVVTVTYTGTQLPATLADEPYVYVENVGGLPYMHMGHFKTISHTYAGAGGTFILSETDGRGWGAYTSGGTFEGSPQLNTLKVDRIHGSWWNKIFYAGQTEGVYLKGCNITGCNHGVHVQEQLTFSSAHNYFAGTRYGFEVNNCGRGEILNSQVAAYDPAQPLASVTAVTKSAGGGVVTYTGDVHPELMGYVRFDNVTAARMAELDGNVYRIKELDTSTRTFKLWKIESSAVLDTSGFVGTWDTGTVYPVMVGAKLTGNSDLYTILSSAFGKNADSQIQPVLLHNTVRGATIDGCIFESAADAAVTLAGTVDYLRMGDANHMVSPDCTNLLLNESTSSKSLDIRNRATMVTDTESTTSTAGHNPTTLSNWQGGDEALLQSALTANLVINGLRHSRPGRKVKWWNSVSPAVAAARLAILEHQSPTLTDATRRLTFPDRMPRFVMPGDFVNLVGGQSEWLGETPARWHDGLDFYSDLHSLTLDQSSSGAGAAIAASSQGASNASRSPFGILELSTGTTNTGGAAIGQMTSLIRAGRGAALFVTRLTVEDLSTVGEEYMLQAGLFDANAATAGEPVNGIYWEYDRLSATAWRTVTSQASTRTKNTGARTVQAGPYFWLGIFMNGDWTRADFFSSLDGAAWTFEASSHSTNIPSGTQTIGFGIRIKKSAGTTARKVHADLIGFRYSQIRGT